MSFLHWFKRKPESSETEAKPVITQKIATEQASTPEPIMAGRQPETCPRSLPDENRATEPQSISPSPEAAPEPEASGTRPLLAAPQLSAPISAFYEKLPAHLLTKESEASLPTAATGPVSTVDAGGEKEIRIRLEPVISDFPPELETPSIRSLIGTQAEIALPLALIQSQLVHGRVVVPAEIFCRALPSDLKPYFAAIDSAEEIPIPLREIFAQLPPEAIKLREDQETDGPKEAIPTPFTAHAEEDAKRFSEIPAIATPPANEVPRSKVEPPRIAFESDSKRLQSLFMTDEPLDLTKTIQKVAELPGLRACILSTTDGLKLAGGLEDPDREKAISALLPELFRHTRSNLEDLGAGALETITLSYRVLQLSTFVQGELCLTVFHDDRPFKPGVREKIQAVISELWALSASGKNL